MRVRIALRNGLLIAWMGVIFRFSATADLKTVPLAQRLGILPALLGPAVTDLLELVLRKSAHVVAFAILALLARYALDSGFPRVDRSLRNALALAFAVLYAVSDEWHQSFVPTRDGRVMDVVIDSAGAAAGLLLSKLKLRR